MIQRELSDALGTIAWYEDILEKAKGYPAWVRERSELGERFQNRTFATLDSLIDPKALRACQNFAQNYASIKKNDKNGIVLSGEVGIGKTHLAAAIANELIDKHTVAVCFGSIVDMLDKIRCEIALHKDTTKYNMKKMPVLIIDDLGKEKRSEWTDQIMFEIINHRYEQRLPVIITTNLEPQELLQRYDKSISSRLIEMCKFVQMTGTDRRGTLTGSVKPLQMRMQNEQ